MQRLYLGLFLIIDKCNMLLPERKDNMAVGACKQQAMGASRMSAATRVCSGPGRV